MADTVSTNESTAVDYIEERNLLLRDIPYETVREAWFTMSHLLLDDGARVVVMGCEDGALTYAMAVLNPKIRFTGVDRSRQTVQDRSKTYKNHNLEFKVGDLSGDQFESQSVDAVINAFTLHQVFSNARYNERIVRDTLRRQFSILKNDGIMFIRDYAKPPQGEYVLMEMLDEPSESDDLFDLSEVDLLIWFSEHAQPKLDPGCGGFFLEELPPRYPKTRLFRLPYKWAYEFIMRKDDREIWDKNLPFEYTFFTVQEFRNELRSLGSRVQYSAPHWDDDYIRDKFEGRFRLLDLDGNAIGDPPTSFIAVACKQPEEASLEISERRVSSTEKAGLDIKSLRNQKTGELVDVVTRNEELAEILPYRIDEDGRLYIYLHDGIIRGVANSVLRSGVNIDGREWSGHMLEPVSTRYGTIKEMGDLDPTKTAEFAETYLDMHATKNGIMEEGPTYYPDPNYIDERIHTYYVPVIDEKLRIAPNNKIFEKSMFQANSVIKEFSAQSVLDAIAVGVIPNSRLELQILSLMQHLTIHAENWISKEINIKSGEIKRPFEVREFLRQTSDTDKTFKETDGSTGQLRRIHSVFVEEGQIQGGRVGLSSENIDFVISDENTVNTAVILPLTKSLKGDIHAGFTTEHMPIPQRFEGNGLSVSAPQYNIPKNITNYRLLKQFIADKFGVSTDSVMKLGPSYFSHIGLTPQRIHPFAVTAAPKEFKDPNIAFIPFYQYMLLWKSISKEQHFMTTLARAYRYLPEHMRLEAKHEVKIILDDIFKAAQPDWSMPVSISPTDSQLAKSRDPHHNFDGTQPTDPLRFETIEKPDTAPVDVSLIDDFKEEIQILRQVIKEEEDLHVGQNPTPEKW